MGFAIRHPDFKTKEDPIDCCSSCSDNGCPAGKVHPSTGCVQLTLSLGKRANGLPAGSLYIHEQDPGSGLSTPAGIKIAAYSGAITKLAGTSLRQVKVDAALADIVTTSATTWEIRFYAPAQIGPVGADGLYNQTGKTAYHTVAFSAQSTGEVFDRLAVTETGDLGDRSYDYVWQQTDTAKAWTLQFLDPTYGTLRQEQVVRGKDAQDRTSKTTSILDGAGTVLSRTTETSERFDWGSEVVLEATAHLDSTGASLGDDRMRTNHYYTTTDAATGALAGRLRETYENAGEKWVQYEYDSSGRVSRRREQFGDCERTAADSACRLTEFDYTYTDLNADTVSDNSTVETRSLLGQVVTRTVEVWYGGDATSSVFGAYRRKWVATAADLTLTDSAAILAAPGTLITKSGYYSTSDPIKSGRECFSFTPDNQIRITEYLSSPITETVSTGIPNATNDKITAGTKTVTVKNSSGGLMSETTTDFVTGKTLALTQATAWDTFGRPTAFSYLDGTTSTQNFDCCGLNNETDRDGVTTSYVRDSMKRVREQTRAGITTKFTLDALGRTTKTQRVAGGTTITTATAAFDSFGHALSSSDALNRTTSVVESTDASGRRVVTTTIPGTGTRIETYALDGSLLSVAGTAAAPVNYEYGVDADGSFVKEIRRGAGSPAASTEWTKSYTDFAGRPSKTVYADAASAQSFFNAKGQLVRSVDPDSVQSLYDYDSLGRASVTALDLDRDGVIDFDGTDRISRTIRSFLTAHGTTVERTVTETWATENTATPSTVATTDRAVDGLRSWSTTNGLPTSSVTAFPTVGNRTETVIAPDNTSVTRSYTQGRLSTETRFAVNATVLEIVRYGYDANARLVETRRYADNATAAADSVTGTLPSAFSLQSSAPGVLATTVTYFDDDQIHTVTTPDPDPTRTGSGYDPQTTTYAYDAAGRLGTTTLADTTTVTQEYFPNGQLKKTYGSRTYPQEYTYDSQGRLKTLKTWQNYASATGAAVTTWNYDPVRGWLLSKRDAANSGPTYTYWPSGRLHTRTWARTVAGQPLVATYTFNNAGDLATIDYSDTTPDVGFVYDRLGRRTTTTDAAGTLVTTYEGLTAATDDETYAAASPLLPGLAVTRTRDSLLRPFGLTAEVTSTKAQVTNAGYSYQPNTGRLDTITAGVLTHTYGYQPQSSLIATLTQKKSGATVLTTTKLYDHLNRLTSAAAVSSVPSVVSSAGYGYNSANQRTRLTREDGAYWSYGYDALGQVTAATKHLPDATPALTPAFAFTFDEIGNRLTASSSVPLVPSVPSEVSTYTPNLLNQYEQRTVPPVVDVLGSAHPDATVTVNFQPTTRQGALWAAELTVDNSAAPVYTSARVIGVRSSQGPNGEDAVAEETRHAFVAQTPERFEYDLDGNLTSDGRWTYAWDAENRLVSMETVGACLQAIPSFPAQRLTFTYDSAGRRLRKRVYGWNLEVGNWQLVSDLRFLWDGWNLLAEFSVQGSELSVLRSYTWGTDLSGSAQGAGGVGGLLAVSFAPTSNSPTSNFFPAYDGNGNLIAAYDSASGTRVADYEYGPFGEVVKSAGPAAAANPFGFSTKYTDAETGLLYYGFRYYNTSTGRWLSRDPIGEKGGPNLYGFVGNNAVSQWDILGKWYGGLGVTGAGTIFVPVSPPLSGGFSASVTSFLVAGKDSNGWFCGWCDSGAVTMMLGVGGVANISVGPVLTGGRGGYSEIEGGTISYGGGVGVPVGFDILNTIEITMDYTPSSGQVMIAYPRIGVGGSAYVAGRISGSCTGCSKGAFSKFSGQAERTKKILQCLMKAARDATNAVNNALASRGQAHGGTLTTSVGPISVDSLSATQSP